MNDIARDIDRDWLGDVFDDLGPLASGNDSTALGMAALRRCIANIHANPHAWFYAKAAQAATLRDPWVSLADHPGGWHTDLYFPDATTAYLELWAPRNDRAEATAVLEALRNSGSKVLSGIAASQPSDRAPEVVLVAL